MLKHLALIAFSTLLMAKDVPMMQELEITLSTNNFNVIEFPFKIKDKKLSAFIYKKKKSVKSKKEDAKENKNINHAKEVEEVEKDPLAGVKLPKSILAYRKKKEQQKLKNTSTSSNGSVAATSTISANLKIEAGDNFLQLFAKRNGKVKMVVYGYRSYPMLLTINFTDSLEKSDRFIRFTDIVKSQKSDKYKGLSHDKICTKLVYDLYHNKVPSGYKTSTPYERYIFDDKLELILTKKLVGSSYSGLEYKVTNISKETYTINESDFASMSVYAASIVNKKLKPNETTRVFIVTSTQRVEDE